MYSGILKRVAILGLPLALCTAALLVTFPTPAAAQSVCGSASLLYCHTACVNNNYCGEMCGQCLCTDWGGGTWYSDFFCGYNGACTPYC